MERTFFALGAISACIAVGTGAFGAHGLKSRVTPEMVAVFDTGARYQMYHALALLAAAWAAARWPGPAITWAGWLFVAGTVVFSGSLYALVLTGVKGLGAVTPVGGLLFLGRLAGAGLGRAARLRRYPLLDGQPGVGPGDHAAVEAVGLLAARAATPRRPP